MNIWKVAGQQDVVHLDIDLLHIIIANGTTKEPWSGFKRKKEKHYKVICLSFCHLSNWVVRFSFPWLTLPVHLSQALDTPRDWKQSKLSTRADVIGYYCWHNWLSVLFVVIHTSTQSISSHQLER